MLPLKMHDFETFVVVSCNMVISGPEMAVGQAGTVKDGEGWVKDEMFHRNKLFLNLLSTKVKDWNIFFEFGRV